MNCFHKVLISLITCIVLGSYVAYISNTNTNLNYQLYNIKSINKSKLLLNTKNLTTDKHTNNEGTY